MIIDPKRGLRAGVGDVPLKFALAIEVTASAVAIAAPATEVRETGGEAGDSAQPEHDH